MTYAMKKYFLEQGQCPHSDFAKRVGIEMPPLLDVILLKAHTYIQYKEKEVANNSRDSRHQKNARAPKHDDNLAFRRGG